MRRTPGPTDAPAPGPDVGVDLIARRFDAHADTYDESRVHVDLTALVARKALASLPGVTTLRVVDVATGTGLVLRALVEGIADRVSDGTPGKGVELTGIDVSAGMLDHARAHLPGATWIQGDATHLPVPGGSLDAVTCAAALHLFPDPAAAVADWVRALRPGGVAVVATFATRGHSHGDDHAPDGHGISDTSAAATGHGAAEILGTPQAIAALLPPGLELEDTDKHRLADDVWLISTLRRVDTPDAQ